MNLAHCLHIALVIGKYTDVIRGDFFSWGGAGRGYGGIFMKNFHGEVIFPMKVAPDFPALFKKDQKFKKNRFFQLKVKSSIKT